MANKPARRIYFATIIPAMLVFFAASKAIDLYEKSASPSVVILILLSLFPVLALITLFWAQWRFINQLDEFLRSVQIKAMLLGLGAILIIVSTWGYLELALSTPPLPIFWLLPLFLATYGISVRILKSCGAGSAL